jgi:hypothetical protein
LLGGKNALCFVDTISGVLRRDYLVIDFSKKAGAEFL